MTMTHLGIGVKDKNLRKINASLTQWLDVDETVFALFKANRFKPQVDGLVITNCRILTVTGVGFANFKIVSEIAAKDISEFTSEKGLGKIIKLFVVKKDSEKIYVCMMAQEDISVASSLLPKMSGISHLIAEKMETVKKAESETKREVLEARKELAAKKTQESKALKIKERQVKIEANQERRVAEVTRIEARGKKLGYVNVKYIGGYGPQYKKTFFESRLNCYENEIEYKDRDITISADQIVGFEITGKEQTNSRLSVTRLVTLGVFSLAAPKRSTKKEASIYVGLKDGRQLMFQTDNLTESDVHRKLANAISHYSSLRANQSGLRQALPTQNIDIAGEIARFADLRAQGMLTDDEFEAKKKQLLGL